MFLKVFWWVCLGSHLSSTEGFEYVKFSGWCNIVVADATWPQYYLMPDNQDIICRELYVRWYKFQRSIDNKVS